MLLSAITASAGPGGRVLRAHYISGSGGRIVEDPMQRAVRVPLVLMLSLSVVAAGSSRQDKPPTPADQYQALRKEYDRMPSGGVPKTDPELLKFVGSIYKHHFAVAPKFLELAEKYPNDPIALDALTQAVWQVNTTPWPVEMVGEDTARAKAF